MKYLLLVLIVIHLTAYSVSGSSDSNIGTGQCGFLDGVTADKSLTRINPNVFSIFETPLGDFYFYDFGNNRIRRVDGKTKIVYTVVGNGVKGYNGDNIPGLSCGLTEVLAIHFSDGKLFYCDTVVNSSKGVRVLLPNGNVVTILLFDSYYFGSIPQFKSDESLKELYILFSNDVLRISTQDFKYEKMFRQSSITSFIPYNGKVYGYSFNDTNWNYNGLTTVVQDSTGSLIIYKDSSTFNKPGVFGRFNQFGIYGCDKSIGGVRGSWKVGNVMVSAMGLCTGYFVFLIIGRRNIAITNTYSTSAVDIKGRQPVLYIPHNCLSTRETTELPFCDDSACSGHGTCFSSVCNCNDGWLGDNSCSKFTCELVNGCGSHGKCIGPNQCVCDRGWIGNDCSQFDCSNLNNCSSHGKCAGSGICECDSGWHGSRDCNAFSCDVFSCFNGGNCTGPNQCTCPSGWLGAVDCSIMSCELGNDCSTHGICTGPNQCKCDRGWFGNDCSQFTCKSCSQRGKCIGPDLCTCDRGWGGSDCSQFDCTTENKCSGNGQCVGPDMCKCHDGWLGSTCSTPICSSNCSDVGKCIAPNNCVCQKDKYGHECKYDFECYGLVPDNVRVCSGIGQCVGPDDCDNTTFIVSIVALSLVIVCAMCIVLACMYGRCKRKSREPERESVTEHILFSYTEQMMVSK